MWESSLRVGRAVGYGVEEVVIQVGKMSFGYVADVRCFVNTSLMIIIREEAISATSKLTEVCVIDLEVVCLIKSINDNRQNIRPAIIAGISL